MKFKMRGVTLMELLVVIVILGILATIAVPSYRRYLLRSQRTEAMRTLMRIQTAQEKFMLQYNTYTDNLTSAPPDGLGFTSTTDTGKYDLTLTSENAGSFVATATARAGQRDDSPCRTLTINQAGTRGATTADGDDNTATCWR
jgi:type IV pilus assembly protein PilE